MMLTRNMNSWILVALSVFTSLLVALPAHAQWVKTSGPDSVQVLARGDWNGIRSIVYAGTKSGVYRSYDSGSTWTSMNNGFTHGDVRALAFANPGRVNAVFAGTAGGGVFRSLDSGWTWTPVNKGLTSLNIRALTFSGSDLFAGTDSGVFRSIDSGGNWDAVNSGLASRNIRALSVSGDIFAGTDSGVFQFVSGDVWTAYNSGLTNKDVRAIRVGDPSILCIGTTTGTFRWNSAWTPMAGMPSLPVRALLGTKGMADGYPPGFLAGTGGGIYLAVPLSFEWEAVNQGLGDLDVQAISAEQYSGMGYVFAGTMNGIWRRPASEVWVKWAALAPRNFAPKKFQISPAGLISFTLPAASRVTLEAFAPDGQRAAMLLSEDLPAGAHTRRLNTAALPNGLYFYRLRAGDLVETRKVMLSK